MHDSQNIKPPISMLFTKKNGINVHLVQNLVQNLTQNLMQSLMQNLVRWNTFADRNRFFSNM